MDDPNQSALCSGNIIRPRFIRLLILDAIPKGPELTPRSVSIDSHPNYVALSYPGALISPCYLFTRPHFQSLRIAVKFSPLSLIT
jgi:hypothetical protein